MDDDNVYTMVKSLTTEKRKRMLSNKLMSSCPLDSSLRACLAVAILALYFCCWENLIKRLNDVNSSSKFVLYIKNRTVHKIYPSHKSVLSQIQSKPKRFMIQLQDQGV